MEKHRLNKEILHRYISAQEIKCHQFDKTTAAKSNKTIRINT